jgi:uncharacterized protein (DUF885 family)
LIPGQIICIKNIKYYSTFLYEAVPGHHYQMSIRMEDMLLPTYRRYKWYGAYGEGWALYSESLGIDIQVYIIPNQQVPG